MLLAEKVREFWLWSYSEYLLQRAKVAILFNEGKSVTFRAASLLVHVWIDNGTSFGPQA